VPRHDRGAGAPVALVDDHYDSRVALSRGVGAADGCVFGSVVDNVDAVDEGWDSGKGGRKQPLLVVGRDDDGERLLFDHVRPLPSIVRVNLRPRTRKPLTARCANSEVGSRARTAPSSATSWRSSATRT